MYVYYTYTNCLPTELPTYLHACIQTRTMHAQLLPQFAATPENARHLSPGTLLPKPSQVSASRSWLAAPPTGPHRWGWLACRVRQHDGGWDPRARRRLSLHLVGWVVVGWGSRIHHSHCCRLSVFSARCFFIDFARVRNVWVKLE